MGEIIAVVQWEGYVIRIEKVERQKLASIPNKIFCCTAQSKSKVKCAFHLIPDQ